MRRSFARRVGVLITVTTALWMLNPDAPGSFSGGSTSHAAPSPVAPDALLENQWHLKDRSVEVGGANVRDAWPQSLGAGVVIGIVDDGLQYTHPDLSPNYLASASWDFNSNDADPQPASTAGHGTAVAGIAAARGDNTIGVSGVAPLAALAGLRLTGGVATDAQEAAAFNFQPSVIHILNNSWNPSDNGTTIKGPGPQAAAARQSAATTGRDGKGRIFVWSSGNGRLSGDDCNFDGYANSRFAIAVGASTDGAVQMPNSEGCSALMVLAPAGGGSRALTTTDLIATPGYDSGDYTSVFGTSTTGGMSAAAPTVSGAVALMLARNPNLTWRDVQHILRRTSVRILPADAGWTPGAFPHNERLGFGLLDAEAAVNMAGTWVNVPAEEVLAPPTENVNLPIPDVNATGISDSITISGAESNFVIEHIEVDFNATHTWRGDIQVKLTSPTGVVSNLAPIRPSDNGDNFTSWKFGSVRHWGQTAAGVWTLTVADRRFQDVGTWNNWTLRIYGYHTSASSPGAFSKSNPASGATGVLPNTTLSWTASSGASSYEYCYDTTNDSACANWINAGANTSAAVSGLSGGVTYYWHVRATNATGVTYAHGSALAFWSFTTLPPPGSFSLSSPANGAIGQSLSPALSWTASSGATNYEYCYDTINNSACDGSWVSAGGATSASLSGLTASTTYYWHVRAVNAGGAMTYAGGSPTTFRAFTTMAAPGAFSHISPGNGATGQSFNPTLFWASSGAATGYEYCYDTTNDGACSAWTGAGMNTSAALNGLAAGTTYYWQVRATNGGGATYAEGSASAYWSFTTAPAPGAFGHSSPSNGATGQALSPTLTWSASAGAVSYEYCYDTTNNGACNATWISVGGATSAGLSGLAGGTPYYWHVRAINSVGTTYAEGNSSAFWSFTTVGLPGAFSHSSPSNGASGQSLSPTLSWGSSSGATSYEYCVDTTNDSACSGWTSTAANTSAALSGLTAGTTYYWQVRATNSGGTVYAEGAPTSFWSFTTLALPGAFNHTSPANGATGQSLNPTLSWGTSAGAVSYAYCVDTTNDSACSGWTSTGANTSVGLSGLTAGTTYYWHARATNASGTTHAGGSATAFSSFTTQVAAPAAFGHNSPGNGAAGLANNPTLSWSASAGAASFEYCIDTTNDNACSGWTSTGANTSVALSNLTAGTAHFWHVRAINAGGTTYADGAATAFWSFTTQVGAPAAFSHNSPANGATGQSTSPTISWGASAGAASYEYCIDTTNDNACSGWTSTAANTSVPLSGLTAGTTYFWHVRAINAGGTTYADGAATAFWSFTTQVAAPAAFSHTSPANGATGQSANPTLTWGASTGAASYEYCIDTTNNNACNATWISTAASTSVGLSGLSAGTTYFWQVRAINAGGTTYADGASTAFWSFTTQVAAPAAFSHTSPANGATGQSANPTLTWGASTGAASYEYCIDTTNNNACNATWVSTGTQTSAGLSGLSAGTAYFWHARAINAGGTTYADGAATAFWSFTTQIGAPGAFGHSSPANGATGQSTSPTISWGASAGAASYEYCIDTTNNNACSGWTSTGTNTSVALNNLTAGTAHYWHVRATNAGGTTYADGAATTFWSFTTQVAAPAAFGHSSPANGATAQSANPTLSWTASTGAASYEYCIDTTNDNACSGWTSTGVNTSVGLTGLTAGTGYYWHVRAINAGGTTYADGAATTFWSFTTQVGMPGAFNKTSPADGATGLPTSVTVTWAASAGATDYEICFDTTDDNACAGWTSTGANTSIELTGLAESTPHYWHVRAINAAGVTYANASPVMFWEVTTMTMAPGAFSHSSPADGALAQSTSPTLSWTASPGAESYEYCVDTTDNDACDASWQATEANTSVGLSGLTADTTYFWHVRAINAGGTTYAGGAATTFWSFVTRSAAPRSIVDLNGDGRGDLFTYDPATGAWARQVTLAGGGFSTSLGAWDSGKTVVPARFNDDGLTDFFVFDAVTGGWTKMLNTGTGFSAQATGTWWPGWQKFVIELNGDGISDLFLYDPVSGQWHRSVSTPTGFTSTTGSWDAGWEITPMNLNGDAYGDLFKINRTTGQWFWVMGAADGNFTFSQARYWDADWAFYAGDFDGDGLTDLLRYRAEAEEHFLALDTAAVSSQSSGADWMAGVTPLVLDLNADGLADLFLYHPTTGQWIGLHGNGAGQFTLAGQGTWTPGWEIHPTDFNDDGRADLALYKTSTGEWFQAWNDPSGAFTYFGGQWQSGLSVVVRTPIRWW